MPGADPGIKICLTADIWNGERMKKYRFRIHLNIGTVIFGVIFIYLMITLFL